MKNCKTCENMTDEERGEIGFEYFDSFGCCSACGTYDIKNYLKELRERPVSPSEIELAYPTNNLPITVAEYSWKFELKLNYKDNKDVILVHKCFTSIPDCAFVVDCIILDPTKSIGEVMIELRNKSGLL
jgi:hypothetical protein